MATAFSQWHWWCPMSEYPLLGLATTQQLFEELRVRFTVDLNTTARHFLNMAEMECTPKQLAYRTVDYDPGT